MVYIRFDGYQNELMHINNIIVIYEGSQMINKSWKHKTVNRYPLKGYGKGIIKIKPNLEKLIKTSIV